MAASFRTRRGAVSGLLDLAVLFTALLVPGLFVALPAGCQHATPEPGPGPKAALDPSPRESLPASDPVAFLQKCLERYDKQGIRGYRLVMEKQERIDGTLEPREVIDVCFRARPCSVFMHWREGVRGASSVLYVEGQNDGKMLVHPTGFIGVIRPVVALDPNGPRARDSGRYSIEEFGLKKTVKRTLDDWKAAQEEGTLHAKYLGTRKLQPAGDVPCYVLRRTMTQPDAEGLKEVTVYLDEKNWFQVGTVQRGEGGVLMGEYFYRDIQLNPEFPPDQFEPAALRR